MPPIELSPLPRIVIYHQTHHTEDGLPISILPLVTQPNIEATHVIVAAIHLNDPPSRDTLHLNNHVPHHPRNTTLWAEVRALQATGVKVLGMLGGAAKGSFARLDLDDATFELYYGPLRDFIRERELDGLDLDIEEPMTLAGVIRLIDRLKTDFGEAFIITLAPVAPALMSPCAIKDYAELFSYEDLEVMRGSRIAWYNAQFYCGWGDMSATTAVDMIMARGWPAQKIVVGMITNPLNGSGWVPFEILHEVFINLRSRYPGLGGVMAWEYFNSLPGDKERPWEWAAWMTRNIRKWIHVPMQTGMGGVPQKSLMASEKMDAMIIDDVSGEAPLPRQFEYFTDESADEL